MAVRDTLEERKSAGRRGIIEENRLYNNLLSSQPLCFNFFGPLKYDLTLATQVLKPFFPDITSATAVYFEYAPNENYTSDNSAFDVAIEVTKGEKRGIIGLECKYTDTFSKEEYSSDQYKAIFAKSRNVFLADYEMCTSSKYNQLFRNQLIAESLMQNKHYDFAYTGLFCHHQDESALDIASQFQGMLKDGDSRFALISYCDFITALQRLEVSWKYRELSMLLWARYCGLSLSKRCIC